MRGVAFKEIAPDPIGHVANDETWLDEQGEPVDAAHGPRGQRARLRCRRGAIRT